MKSFLKQLSIVFSVVLILFCWWLWNQRSEKAAWQKSKTADSTKYVRGPCVVTIYQTSSSQEALATMSVTMSPAWRDDASQVVTIKKSPSGSLLVTDKRKLRERYTTFEWDNSSVPNMVSTECQPYLKYLPDEVQSALRDYHSLKTARF